MPCKHEVKGICVKLSGDSLQPCIEGPCPMEELRAMEWISVKDRLPEEGQRVITWHDNQDGHGGYIGMRYNVFDYFDDVTHWMNLPEPPTEGTK